MQKRFMNKPSDRGTSTMLRVPNDEEGRGFLQRLRFYSAHGTRITAVGRGPRRHEGRRYSQKLPQRFATSLAVYIQKVGQDYMQILRTEAMSLHQKAWNLTCAQREIEVLK